MFNRPTRFSVGLGLLTPADVAGRLANPQPDSDPVPPARPTEVTVDLDHEAMLAESLFRDWGGRSLAAPDKAQYQQRPPWIEQPEGSQPFILAGAISTPNNNGTDTTVITMTVPPGWDGIINQLANLYTGAGFTLAGLGNLTWRLLRNGQPIKGFDALQISLGTYAGACAVSPQSINPVRVFAGDVVTVVVNHAASSPLPVGGTQTLALLGGYLYPKD